MKFYMFSQNNSGGSFIINKDVAELVAIEAENAKEANKRAEEIGIYFDGVDEGSDCDCCGDRWSRACDLEEGVDPFNYTSWSKKKIIVYHADGRKSVAEAKT